MRKKVITPFLAVLLSCTAFQCLSADHPPSVQPRANKEELLRNKAQAIGNRIFEGEQPIDERVKRLGNEIEGVFDQHTPEELQKILSDLTHSLISNIGGYSLGATSLVKRKTSDHLVLAHYVNDFMNRIGLALDKSCMTWTTGAFLMGTQTISCEEYLKKNPVSEKYQNKINALAQLYKSHKEILPPPQKAPEPQVMKTEDEIDDSYRQFLMKHFPHLEQYQDQFVQPAPYMEEVWRQYGDKNIPLAKNLSFPPGKYAYLPLPNGGIWIPNMFEDSMKHYNPSGQGWKIHITAMPHSAEKIAELILPHLNDFNSSYGITETGMKIVISIPLMRSGWYIGSHIPRLQTQLGKFLVVYAVNTAHAYQLVKKFDEILNDAKKKGILTDKDFLPLTGDAKVGHSGGVYVRYGRFTNGSISEVDPSGKEISFRMLRDDRSHPWPDFMNKQERAWRDAPNPFKELPLEWNQPEKGLITWEMRPESWESGNAPNAR